MKLIDAFHTPKYPEPKRGLRAYPVALRWAFAMLLFLACKSSAQSAPPFDFTPKQPVNDVHPLNEPDRVTTVNLTSESSEVINPPAPVCANTLDDLASADIHAHQVPTTVLLGTDLVTITVDMPDLALNRMVFSLEDADTISYLCAALTELVTADSPLSSSVKQKIFEYQQQLLLLSHAEAKALCGDSASGCYLPELDYTVATLANGQDGAYGLFHELSHKLNNVQPPRSMFVGWTPIDLNGPFVVINGEINIYVPEFFAEITAHVLGRWAFGQFSAHSSHTYRSAYLAYLSRVDDSMGVDNVAAAAHLAQWYNAGLNRLVFTPENQLGMNLINALEAQDMETAFTIIAAAFEPNKPATADTGIDAVRYFSEEYERLVELLPPPTPEATDPSQP